MAYVTINKAPERYVLNDTHDKDLLTDSSQGFQELMNQIFPDYAVDWVALRILHDKEHIIRNLRILKMIMAA